MKPIRIQRKRTKGWKKPDNTIYVGRYSKWGNPFNVGKFFYSLWPYGYGCRFVPTNGYEQCNTREKAVANFKAMIDRKSHNWSFIQSEDIKKELRGKNLMCWCPLNEPCHADVLLEIANRDEYSTSTGGK